MNSRSLLLAALPEDFRERLARASQTVTLEQGQIVHRPGERIESVYFPLDCLVSVTITMAGVRTDEAGIVGRREMVGLNALMGGCATNQTESICQAAGDAVRIQAEFLLGEFDGNKAVRNVLLKYTQAYIAQISQNVACSRVHSMEQRLARWMLECRERLQTDDLGITHEFIAQLLGVRPAGISGAAATLQRRRLIDYGSESLGVIDAVGLEGVSCGCFRVVLDEYDRLLGIAH